MGGLSGHSYRDVVKVLKRLEFAQCRRAKGSHQIWKHDYEDRFTTVPFRQGKDIPEGTLRHILDQAGISKEEFLAKL